MIVAHFQTGGYVAALVPSPVVEPVIERFEPVNLAAHGLGDPTGALPGSRRRRWPGGGRGWKRRRSVRAVSGWVAVSCARCWAVRSLNNTSGRITSSRHWSRSTTSNASGANAAVGSTVAPATLHRRRGADGAYQTEVVMPEGIGSLCVRQGGNATGYGRLQGHTSLATPMV
jgi:hypothetical protein